MTEFSDSGVRQGRSTIVTTGCIAAEQKQTGKSNVLSDNIFCEKLEGVKGFITRRIYAYA